MCRQYCGDLPLFVTQNLLAPPFVMVATKKRLRGLAGLEHVSSVAPASCRATAISSREYDRTGPLRVGNAQPDP